MTWVETFRRDDLPHVIIRRHRLQESLHSLYGVLVWRHRHHFFGDPYRDISVHDGALQAILHSTLRLELPLLFSFSFITPVSLRWLIIEVNRHDEWVIYLILFSVEWSSSFFTQYLRIITKLAHAIIQLSESVVFVTWVELCDRVLELAASASNFLNCVRQVLTSV